MKSATKELLNLFSNDVHIFYWRGAKNSNFGDQLNIDIMEYFGYKPIHSTPGNAELFALGSILHFYNNDYNGIIVGSGYIMPPNNVPNLKSAKILALRGPITNSFLGNLKITLCDPGLLAKKIFGEKKSKIYQAGIVPHFDDANDINLNYFLERYKNVICIDALKKPKDVIELISQCDLILSSSLHGLVIADSYNIPAVWVNFADRQTGGEFKYFDYHKSLGIHRERVDIVEDSTLDFLKKYAVKVSSSITDDKASEIEFIFNNLKKHLVILRFKRFVKRVFNSLPILNKI